MEERLDRHYRLELDFLRQLGAEFAETHPDIAKHLGYPYQTEMDPHVERLREGFALLSARIRAKIEDEQPEITEALLGVLYQQYLQPIPSMSVIRFDPAADKSPALAKGPVIEAGAVLRSERTGTESACEFRTCYPVTLWPLQAEAAVLSLQVDASKIPGPAPAATLTIPIRCVGNARLGQLDPKAFRSLRFYLGGAGRSPFALRDRLIHDVTRIEVAATREGKGPEPLVIARNAFEVRRAVRAVGFEANEGVLPNAPGDPLGSRNLREFFAFPEKYRFFEVSGLGDVVKWGQATGFDLRFYLSRPPEAGVVVRKESVQLYCTPIVNLFSRTCKVDRDGRRVEYLVEPPEARETAHREHFEVASIDSVRSDRGVYPRYDDLRPRAPGKGHLSWYARRRPSAHPDSKRTQVLLSFLNEGREVGPPDDPTVTVKTTCTNLDLPTRLPINGLRLQHTAPFSGLTPLAPMTVAQPPPTARKYHWRLISHLALNHLPIGDPEPAKGFPWSVGRGTEVLREILRLHDPIDDETTRRQIQAVRGVFAKHEFRSLPADRRAVVGGVRFTIDFGEDAFSQHGMLLAEVIDHFLGNYVSLNAWTQLVAMSGARKVKEWEPRAGAKILV